MVQLLQRLTVCGVAVSMAFFSFLSCSESGSAKGGEASSLKADDSRGDVVRPFLSFSRVDEERSLGFDLLADTVDDEIPESLPYFSMAELHMLWPDRCEGVDLSPLHSRLLHVFLNDSVGSDLPSAVENYLGTPFTLEPARTEGVHVVDEVEEGRMNISSKSVDLGVYTLCGRYVTMNGQTDMYMAGAAHGLRQDYYVTFDLQEGRLVELDDLVSDVPRLARMLTDIYLEPRGLDGYDFYLTGKDDRGSSALRVTHNFFFDDGSINFAYQPYEIGCYAEGEIVLEVPIYQLEEAGILTPYARNLMDL